MKDEQAQSVEEALEAAAAERPAQDECDASLLLGLPADAVVIHPRNMVVK